mgnify:CR=1 FL=1
MRDIATLAEHAVHGVQDYRDPAEEAAESTLQTVSATVRKLFMLLHGSYGSLFTSKFTTGQMAGKYDKGMISAMKVWDAKLSRFSAAVVEEAAAMASKVHKDFPPNLPEFESLCESVVPRKEWAREQGLPRLAAPVSQEIRIVLEPRNDGKDWARRIVARMEAGDASVSYFSGKSARKVLGLEAAA